MAAGTLPSPSASSAGSPSARLGLYVHVPFCVHKCGYCDFNSWAETRREPMQRWLAAFDRQARMWGEHLNRPALDTVFFGGGTPSLLENDLLVEAGQIVQRHFGVDASTEFSIECNPETLNRDKLQALAAAGANRLSVGVQSFQDRFLERLERRARGAQNDAALELIAQEWKGRWSLDLMFGLPGQSQAEWQDDLQRALAYKPQHVSAYQLTLGTSRSKAWRQPSEDILLALFDQTENAMAAAGLERYEISNFARPGFEGRHNLRYWRLQTFLGLGPGAAGLLNGSSLGDFAAVPISRFGAHQRQPENFDLWVVAAGEPAREATQFEARNAVDHLSEMMMMGLRLREGLAAARFGALAELLPDLWRVEQDMGFIHFNDSVWVPTLAGLKVLDSLLPRLINKIEARVQKDAGRDLDLNQIDPNF